MNTTNKNVFRKLYPEMPLGDYPRYSHKVEFFNRVHAILEPQHVVLDFGAGRGASSTSANHYENALMNLRGRCSRVIGVDTSASILENENLDERHCLAATEALPVADNSIDIVVSWAVFEHIESPEHVTAELRRVLKPGGWLCAFTPNKFGDLALIARLVPNSLHPKLLKRIGMVDAPGSTRSSADVFPTWYRLNTERALKRHFPVASYNHHSYRTLGPPGYNAGSLFVARCMQLYDVLTPAFMSRMWHIFIQKR